MTERNDILLIVADQLAWNALSACGNTWIDTPNIDRIRRRGMRFANCYTPTPLCQPARAAFWTGHWPHQTGVLSNGRKHHVPQIPATLPTVGELLSAAGYTAIHVGKKHDAGSLRGFQVIEPGSTEVAAEPAWMLNYDTFQDRYATDRVVEILRQQQQQQPLFLVADLNNPHNICGWVGENQGPHTDLPIDAPLPPLPPNFTDEAFTNRPLPVQYICCTHNRLAQTEGWNEQNYRHYLAAYRHYVERLDGEVGRILDALESRKGGAETLVIFTADHGDGMAAHRMVTKQVSFIDEVTRVPMMIAGPGVAGRDRLDSTALVSLLDLMPTLCEVAGIEPPPNLWGRSLMPWIREGRHDSPHDYLACEWHTEWGFTVEPGRMIRTAHHKYTRYLEADGEELYDLVSDPGERRNLAPDAGCAEELDRHRELLRRHCDESADLFFDLAWYADPRWRSHAPGYEHHQGPAAPMVG